MTDLLARPVSSRTTSAGPASPPRSVLRLAAVAGAGAAGAGLLVVGVVVVVSWAFAPAGASASDALRAVGQIWLLGHRVSIAVPGGHVALLPIGLLAVPAFALLRAGEWFAHAGQVTEPRAAVGGGLAIGCVYGTITAMVAAMSVSRTIQPSGGQALVAGLCVGSVFGTLGTVRGAGLLGPLWAAIPLRARSVLKGAGLAVAAVLATGFVLAMGGLLAHTGRVAELGGNLDPGVVGSLALGIASLAYLPDAVIWGASYAVGPGFAVGVGTGVSPLGVDLGALPSFPLLGGLPADGPAPLLALPFVLAPLIAGAAAGRLVIRTLPVLRLEEAALWGFGTGALAGGVLGVLAAIASGPAGPGRLDTIGPSGWQVGLAAGLELGLAAALAAVETQRRLMRR